MSRQSYRTYSGAFGRFIMTFLKKASLIVLQGICGVVALCPWFVIYALADTTFFFIYYIIRYRRKVVDANLAECFPDMSVAQRNDVARRFYRNFADIIFETVKLLHISDDDVLERMQFDDIAVMQRLIDQKRPIAIYFAHTGNWEWAPSVTLHLNAPGVDFGQVYRPLRNEVMDKLMLGIRSRFGSVSYPKATVFRSLFRQAREGVLTVTGFMSDQKPSHGDPTLPVLFLNRPTAMITGTETLARRLHMAAVYWDMEKLSRGHYRIRCRLLADDVARTPEHEVTMQYARMLQQTIKRNPAIWLWTHKRWKIPVVGHVSQL